MMYRIEKRFTIPTGHRLSKHAGLCKNFHGHNLTILVGLKSKFLNKQDMIVDFSVISQLVKQYLEQFDHCFLLNKVDEDLYNVLKDQYGFKVEMLDFDPTAERLAEMMFLYLSEKFHDTLGCELEYVTVYENENSKATYSLE
jgi:6-pyruvoyltetrahydropterin/6-carboxytetrahydropterin synthase